MLRQIVNCFYSFLKCNKQGLGHVLYVIRLHFAFPGFHLSEGWTGPKLQGKVGKNAKVPENS